MALSAAWRSAVKRAGDGWRRRVVAVSCGGWRLAELQSMRSCRGWCGRVNRGCSDGSRRAGRLARPSSSLARRRHAWRWRARARMGCWHRAQLVILAHCSSHTATSLQARRSLSPTPAAAPPRPHRHARAMAALLAQLAGSGAAGSARISTSTADLSRAGVNVVHVARPHAALDATAAAVSTRRPLKQAVVVDARRPDAALEQLLSGVELPEVQQQLHADISQGVQLLSTTLQQDHLRVALEVVLQQSCPVYHADHVRLRMLCTYAGPGTWFVANRQVRRSVSWTTGDVSIAAVDSRHALQAAAGDLLFLKGNSFPGLAGAGAVHKSPALQEGERRLLLTVDDACGCQ